MFSGPNEGHVGFIGRAAHKVRQSRTQSSGLGRGRARAQIGPVSRPSPRFLSLVTRTALPEMIAPTYAKLKNLDPNDAYHLLTTALSDMGLLEQVQQAVWRGLEQERAGMDEVQMVVHLEKRLSKKKSKRFKPAMWRSAEEGAYVALGIAFDKGAGVASGEAVDLLYSPGGQELFDTGLRGLGLHLAKELLR